MTPFSPVETSLRSRRVIIVRLWRRHSRQRHKPGDANSIRDGSLTQRHNPVDANSIRDGSLTQRHNPGDASSRRDGSLTQRHNPGDASSRKPYMNRISMIDTTADGSHMNSRSSLFHLICVTCYRMGCASGRVGVCGRLSWRLIHFPVFSLSDVVLHRLG